MGFRVIRNPILSIFMAAFVIVQQGITAPRPISADPNTLDPEITHKAIVDLADRGPSKGSALIAMKALKAKVEELPFGKNPDGSSTYYLVAHSKASRSKITWAPLDNKDIVFVNFEAENFTTPCISSDKIKEEMNKNGWSIRKDNDYSWGFLLVELEKGKTEFSMLAGQGHCIFEAKVKQKG